MTGADLEEFWRAFTLMFDHDRASARGEMNLRRLYVVTHDDPYGRAPARTLLDLVKIKGPGDATACSIEDYTIEINDADLSDGVTLTRLIG